MPVSLVNPSSTALGTYSDQPKRFSSLDVVDSLLHPAITAAPATNRVAPSERSFLREVMRGLLVSCTRAFKRTRARDRFSRGATAGRVRAIGREPRFRR